MPYQKPGISIEYLIQATAATVQTPLLMPAVLGPVYQVENKRYAGVYKGLTLTVNYPAQKSGAVVDQGAGSEYPPKVYIQHDGTDYDVTTLVATTGSNVALTANLEHRVAAGSDDGVFKGTDQEVFESAKANFITAGVAVGDYVKVGSAVYRIKQVESGTRLSLTVGPAAAASDQTYTIVRRLRGDILISYRAARKDSDVVGKYLEADSVDALEDLFGEDAVGTHQNPLGLGMFLAMTAGGVKVAGSGIDPESSTPAVDYQDALESLERRYVYHIAPLTMDSSIHDLVIAHVDGLSQKERRRPRRAYISRSTPTEEDVRTGTLGIVTAGRMDAADNPFTDFNAESIDGEVKALREGDVVTVAGLTTEHKITAVLDHNIQVRPDFSGNELSTGYGATAAVTAGERTSGKAVVLDNTPGAAFAGSGNLDVAIVNGSEVIVATGGYVHTSHTLTFGSAVLNSGSLNGPTTKAAIGTDARFYAISGGTTQARTFTVSRTNSRGDQANDLAQVARGIKNERVTLVAPDTFDFSIGGETVKLNGFYVAACRAGQRAGVRIGRPLIYASVPGPTGGDKSVDYFTEDQLDVMGGAGCQLYVQNAVGAPVICRDDLTTRQSDGPRYGQESEVVARDYLSYTLADTLQGSVGSTNVTPRTIEGVALSIDAVLSRMLGEQYQPFTALALSSIEASTTEKGRITATITATQSDPYTGTDITIVV